MITREQIQKLSDDAGEHGDTQQVEICALALEGDAEAVRQCERVIADAAAQRD